MNDFEFDDDKSKANLEKHGIDFQTAQELWKDPDLLEFQAKSEDEPRLLAALLKSTGPLLSHTETGAFD